MLRDIPAIREAGRWAKRARLRALRAVTSEKARYNTLLNQREIWQGRVRLESFPREIQVGTNWTCNLKCFFCKRETTDKDRLAALPKNELEIPEAAMETLVRILPCAEIFTLTPLGEPLMYSGLNRILERYRASGACNLQMTTNGNIVKENQIRQLVESRARRIYVSIDSADPAMYAELRAGGSLDKVSEFLHRVNEWKDRLDSDMPEIIIAATFMRRNIPHLAGLVEFAHAHRIERISVQLMEAEDAELEPETLGHHIPLAVQSLREARRVADERGVELLIHLALRNLISAHAGEAEAAALLADAPAIDMRGTTLMRKCTYPFTFLVIDTDADARPCCWTGMSFGKLDSDFDAVWNGPRAQTMRRNFFDNHIPNECRGTHCRVDL
jgi:MoaA/NifB/PqqE/SkfB family radical SAM enzyme